MKTSILTDIIYIYESYFKLVQYGYKSTFLKSLWFGNFINPFSWTLKNYTIKKMTIPLSKETNNYKKIDQR